MSDGEATVGTSIRVLRAGVAISLALLMTMGGSASLGSGARAATRPARCASAGQVYKQDLLVQRENGELEWERLALVCGPDHVVKIVDADGREYEDLADFRAHNHLFSKDDKITVPRSFPSIGVTGNSGVDVVSGHSATSSGRRWLIAGLAAVPIIGGAAWAIARRRRADP
ncbi:hypothetical protein [Actinomadura terrae]|uniref:hypothetical protein n=1 Tax=Actinomadura terrae TaxID=604353 RepID=UPI001FA7E168|nr:hypothetical protein [Actinomadura terrae]